MAAARRADFTTNTVMKSPVTWLLIIVNVALYIVVSVQGGTFLHAAVDSQLLNDTVLVPYMLGFGEYWRLLTSGFMHFGLLHIAFNMYALWVLGRDVEMALGSARFCVLYILSLLAGSATVVWYADPDSATAGASGAIFGLLGAELIVVLALKAKVSGIITVIVLNVAIGVAQPGISIQAHLGGFVVGFLVAGAFIFVPRWVAAIRQRHNTGGGVVYDPQTGEQLPAYVTSKQVNAWGWGTTAIIAIAIVIALVAGVDKMQQLVSTAGEVLSPTVTV